jgi:hypothetical protein
MSLPELAAAVERGAAADPDRVVLAPTSITTPDDAGASFPGPLHR